MPIAESVKLGDNVHIFQQSLVNLYGCQIGDETRIVHSLNPEERRRIGARCKISSHTFICEGVVIEDEVFVGHGVIFINDKTPRATAEGHLQTEADWRVVPTRVKKGASIGSGAVVLCGVTIDEKALIGAGAVVTRDVPAGAIVTGCLAIVWPRRTAPNRYRFLPSVPATLNTVAAPRAESESAHE